MVYMRLSVCLSACRSVTLSTLLKPLDLDQIVLFRRDTHCGPTYHCISQRPRFPTGREDLGWELQVIIYIANYGQTDMRLGALPSIAKRLLPTFYFRSFTSEVSHWKKCFCAACDLHQSSTVRQLAVKRMNVRHCQSKLLVVKCTSTPMQ